MAYPNLNLERGIGGDSLLQGNLSTMGESVERLWQRNSSPAPPSSLLAPPPPPAPPPPSNRVGYLAEAKHSLASAGPMSGTSAIFHSPQEQRALAPWVKPPASAFLKIGSGLGDASPRMPDEQSHEMELMGRLLQGLEESRLSVRDVVGVLESSVRSVNPSLDAKIPKASWSSRTPRTGVEFVASAAKQKAEKEEDPLARIKGECPRCRALERQLQAVSQSLAGLSARLFNWSNSPAVRLSEQLGLWEMTLQYLQPCAHIDFQIAETCARLAASIENHESKKPVSSKVSDVFSTKRGSQTPFEKKGINKAPAADFGDRNLPVIEEVAVSFKASEHAKRLNGSYSRRKDLKVNQRSVYCLGNRHLVFLDDDTWAIKEGADGDPQANVYAFCEDRAMEPFAVLSEWQVLDDHDGFVSDREGVVRRSGG
eukprot:TRINITY_DN3416_c6_g1_i1.p1 TRINITY_DN3416_c6_g1~~TRINITY_DN3416_c6_g1_i1.p1  ORF type:complete len:426 (-),score=78.31 TRINITY_DN3416_c6_g1_i1:57-1334(-)